MSCLTVRHLAQARSVATTPTLTVALLAALTGSAAVAGPDPDCQCRDPTGTLRDLGTLACVPIGTSRYLVRCEMSTNTPYWRRVGDDPGCPPVT